MLEKYATGLQHLGIPSHNLETSISFYKKLGFKKIHRKHIHHNNTPVEAAFMELSGFVIELYQLEGDLLDEVRQRGNGHIDHYAIDISDVDSLFDKMKTNDFTMLDEEIQEIDFFNNGVRFFRILGPSNEVIELNQIIGS